MGNVVNDVVSVGTFGLVNDVTGSEAAAEAQRNAQSQALQAERGMFDESMAFQRELWDWQKQQAEPWREAGLGAMGQYQDTMQQGFSFNPQADPVYGARLSELSKAIGASGAAKGMQLSSRTLRGLRDMTAQELGASYGRQYGAYQQNLSNLAGIINVGTGSSMNLSNIGQQYGQTVTGLQQQMGANTSQYYQNLGQIGAAEAQSGWNSLVQVGQLGAMAYGGGAFSGGGGPVSATPSGAYGPMRSGYAWG